MLHIGSAERGVLHHRQQTVEGVTKLVEERRRLVEGEERRLLIAGRGKVGHQADYRAYPFVLLHIIGHPGTGPLPLTREVVEQQSPQQLSLAQHVVRLHIGMVDRQLSVASQLDPVELTGETKHRLHDGRELEVGSRLLLLIL